MFPIICVNVIGNINFEHFSGSIFKYIFFHEIVWLIILNYLENLPYQGITFIHFENMAFSTCSIIVSLVKAQAFYVF